VLVCEVTLSDMDFDPCPEVSELPRRVPPKGSTGRSRFFDLSKRQSGFCLSWQKTCTQLRFAHMPPMKASVRSTSLTVSGTGDKSLGGMEKHGKRLDGTSQERCIHPDREPLIWGGLDLHDRFKKHVVDAKMNKGLKRPVMHALVQFPTEINPTLSNQKKMLRMAVEFINTTHGGDAVFAARLDRDEQGQHSVDVFYSPKYIKTTKARGDELWISNSKHGKELCEKHRNTIVTRHRDGKFDTSPRSVGIALQEELHAFMAKYGVKLEERKKKDRKGPDRLSPEAYKVQQENKKRSAQERENLSLRKALAHVYKGIIGVEGITVPRAVMVLLERLYQKQFPDQSGPINPSDLGLKQAQGAAKPRRNDGPSQGPSAGL